MQIMTIPATQTLREPVNVSKENDTKLQAYLQSISWETNEFTNAKLEGMLAASCLRYLEGIADIFFVIGLAQEIERKYGRTMKLSIGYSYEILSDLAKKLKNKSLLLTDRETINELVNDAQEVITQRRYQSESKL